MESNAPNSRLMTVFFLLILSAAVVFADGAITEQDLLEPDWKSWLTYSGDYSGQRHSALDRIRPVTYQAGCPMGLSSSRRHAVGRNSDSRKRGHVCHQPQLCFCIGRTHWS